MSTVAIPVPSLPIQSNIQEHKKLCGVVTKSSDVSLTIKPKPVCLGALKKFAKAICNSESPSESIALEYLKLYEKNIKYIVNAKQIEMFLPNINIKSEKKLLALFGVTPTDACNPDNPKETLYFFHPHQYILATMINSVTYSDLDKRIEFAFLMYDHDDDGKISRSDIKQMLTIYGKEFHFKIDDNVINSIIDAIFYDIHDKCYEELITLNKFKEFFQNFGFQSIKIDVFERSKACLSIVEDGKPQDMNLSCVSTKSQGSTLPPKVEKKPSGCNRVWLALKNRYYIEGPKRIWLSLWLVGLAYFFVARFLAFSGHDDNLAVPIAKGSAAVINYCMGIMLALVTKSLTTILRKIGLARLLPLNFNVYFHTILAFTILIAAWIHSIVHVFFILKHFSECPDIEELNEHLVTEMDQVKPYTWWLFSSIPGWTGLISLILITFMSILALKKLRKQSYERFWYSHALWIVVIGLLIVHGCCKFLGPSNFWYWICFPTLVLLSERIYPLIIYLRKRHKIVDLVYLESDIIELRVSKPNNYNFIPGQYAQINIPKISMLQWHPFTFSSSQNKDELSFHISPVGDWTKELKKLAIGHQTKKLEKLPTIYLRGPYGAPSQHYSTYKHLMIISSGVGATPFAAIMQDLSQKAKDDPKLLKRIKSVDFFWVNRKPSSHIWLNSLFKDLQGNEAAKAIIKLHMFFTNPHHRYDLRSLLLWKGLEILHKNGMKIGGMEYFDLMHWGRPDWNEIFQKKAQEIKKGTVGVFFCGNNYLAKELHKKCLEHSGKVTFKFIKEVF